MRGSCQLCLWPLPWNLPWLWIMMSCLFCHLCNWNSTCHNSPTFLLWWFAFPVCRFTVLKPCGKQVILCHKVSFIGGKPNMNWNGASQSSGVLGWHLHWPQHEFLPNVMPWEDQRKQQIRLFPATVSPKKTLLFDKGSKLEVDDIFTDCNGNLDTSDSHGEESLCDREQTNFLLSLHKIQKLANKNCIH